MAARGRTTAAALLVAPLAATLLSGTASLVGTAAPTYAAPGWSADLRADSNRDGQVDLVGLSDEAVEEMSGAIFLPNLDDDSRRCATPSEVIKLQAAKVKPEKLGGGNKSIDRRLSACHDAADEVVNGVADEADLARLMIPAMPSLPADAVGRISVDNDHARVFVATASGWSPLRQTSTLSGVQLKAGVRLAVEGTDVVRDAADWDGTAHVTLSITSGGTVSSDQVKLTLAPMLTHHHLQAAEQVLTTSRHHQSAPLTRFRRDVAVAARLAGVPEGTRPTPGKEYWPQDFVEPMYVSMPTPTGVHGMRLLLRSDQERPDGTALFGLRGVDVGVVWLGPKVGLETLNSFGNLETIPPYTFGGQSFPAGRVVLGTQRPRFESAPAERVLRLLTGQGQQPGGSQQPLLLDTSWLSVGHVDEFVSFLPADTDRGWKVAVADPLAALDLLRKLRAAGRGDAELLPIDPGVNPTVNEALRPGKDGAVWANRFAAQRIEANLVRLKAATGITEADVVRIPVLYKGLYDAPRPRAMVGMIPNALNAPIWYAGAHTPVAAVARQHTVRLGGRDLFADAVRAAYARAGVRVSFVDDYETHHVGMGDVHCGTNTLRDFDQPWWDQP